MPTATYQKDRRAQLRARELAIRMAFDTQQARLLEARKSSKTLEEYAPMLPTFLFFDVEVATDPLQLMEMVTRSIFLALGEGE